MAESIDKRTLPPDNLEAEKQREQKESERYLGNVSKHFVHNPVNPAQNT